MTPERRLEIYRRSPLTARQYRQIGRMGYRYLGLDSHGATGERIRRPLEFTSKPPERGSFRTHIAAYCAPCDVHWRRPRLHRYPIGVTS
jgi:hypothetical protein